MSSPRSQGSNMPHPGILRNPLYGGTMEEAVQEVGPTHWESNTGRRFPPVNGSVITSPSERLNVQWPSKLVEENTIGLSTSSFPESSSTAHLSNTADSASLEQSIDPTDDAMTLSAVSTLSTWGHRRKAVSWTRPSAIACLLFVGMLATALLVKYSFSSLLDDEVALGADKSPRRSTSHLELPSKPRLPDDSGSEVSFGHHRYKGSADHGESAKRSTQGPVWPKYLTGEISHQTFADSETREHTMVSFRPEWLDESPSNSSDDTEKGNSTSADESINGNETTAESTAAMNASTEADAPAAESIAAMNESTEAEAPSAESTDAMNASTEVEAPASGSPAEQMTDSGEVATESNDDQRKRRNLADRPQDRRTYSTKTGIMPAAVCTSDSVATAKLTAPATMSTAPMPSVPGANISADDQLRYERDLREELRDYSANTTKENITTGDPYEYKLTTGRKFDELDGGTQRSTGLDATRAQPASLLSSSLQPGGSSAKEQSKVTDKTIRTVKTQQSSVDITIAPTFNDTLQWTNVTIHTGA